MNKNLEKLRELSPNKNIQDTSIFFIDGKVLVTKKFISMDMNVTERQVNNWEKKGLEASEYSMPKLRLYDLHSLKTWYSLNIETKYGKGNESDLIDQVMYKTGDEVTAFNAKSAKEVEEATIKIKEREIIDIKANEVKGEYIKADDVDKTTTAMAVILLSAWRSLLDTLPPLLTDKSQSEVFSILDNEFAAEVEVLNKKVNEA